MYHNSHPSPVDEVGGTVGFDHSVERNLGVPWSEYIPIFVGLV